MLSDILRNEADRDKALSNDAFERLLCQSVVEDIVFSAIRWCRVDQTKAAGRSVLRQVVEQTTHGTYWDTSVYAMRALAFYSPQDMNVLLEAYSALASMETLNHPSNPSLRQERKFVEQLKAGSEDVFDPIRFFFEEKDQAVQQYIISREHQRLLDALIVQAQRFDVEAR